jgi:hypothetical protein
MIINHEHIWQYNNFPNQTNENEKIFLIVRQDESILKRKITKYFFLILLLFILKTVIQNFYNLDQNAVWFFFINTVFYFLICVLMVKFAFFCHKYFLSFWAITNERIINHCQNNFFQADISSIWYKNIQQLTLINESASNTLNNVADIVIELKGEGEQENKIILNNIPSPHQVIVTIKAFLS